jgi:hypothetical protein
MPQAGQTKRRLARRVDSLDALVARHSVRQEAPGGGVSLRRKQVAPVLADEPGADEGRDLAARRQAPQFGDPTDDEDREHAQASGALVDAKTAEVDARAKPVAFKAQQVARVNREG